VREFYDSYAEDLRQHRREAIAERYDPRGVFFLGHGVKTLRSFEETKNRYLTKWAGPKSFEWKDISVEVLSPHAAVVVGLFDWQVDTGQTLTYSYTGLLVKQSGRWRIRVEDESARPPRPPSQ
jgi:ketosteroid isomerase-like protein